MKLAILQETAPGERRVAATPETVREFVALGALVAVERGAGICADIVDDEFIEVGAALTNRDLALDNADIVLCVQGPPPGNLQALRPGALLVGNLDPHGSPGRIAAYAQLGLETYSMDMLPPSERAGPMDTLSSQSIIAGYRAVIEASHQFGRSLSPMMTAAGAIPAARVFVMGAGRAGLQAIATAKRLGARVSATDISPVAREEFISLGAEPIFLEELCEDEHGDGMSPLDDCMSEDAYECARAELLSAHIARQDIVITAAQIPERPAPRLISHRQVALMRRGSVIVDLAADSGCNVEGAAPGEVVSWRGVSIVAHRNMPSRQAADASVLFARNLCAFLGAFWEKGAPAPIFPPDDEIVNAVRLTRDGQIVNSVLRLHPIKA